MSHEGAGQPESEDEDEDAQAVVDTGIRDQQLVISGWGASHADSGTPGPHVHLSTNDRQNAVLKTSQIPQLVDALQTVGERIDRMWEQDGATWFTGDEPDDNDPTVIQQRHIHHLVLLDNLRTHFAEVAEILLRSNDLHDASAAIAPLLGIDETEVSYQLNSINLFAMTRTPSEARTEKLAGLRHQP
jgi:hypothetical protein